MPFFIRPSGQLSTQSARNKETTCLAGGPVDAVYKKTASLPLCIIIVIVQVAMQYTRKEGTLLLYGRKV